MTPRVSVIRDGAAVEWMDGEHHRLIRAIDLYREVGKLEAGAITGATLDGSEHICIELANASSVRVEIARSASPELVITGGRLITCDGDSSDPLELIDDGALVLGGGKILWRGLTGELPTCGFDLADASRLEARGRLVSPGLIDCHTHLVFGGERAEEFGMRSAGAGYQEIAKAGGGIASTRGKTLAADRSEHLNLATRRLESALRGGTTTLEGKSGYALTEDGELELLAILGILDAVHPVDIDATLLGAHVVPPEMAADRAAYVDLVAAQMIPKAAAAKLCSAVDVYCDDGAFTLDETRAILSAARAHGLEVKAHVGQFADLGGPQLLSELGGLSADHLEEISTAGIAALAAGGVVAVMLPTACVQLGQKPPPVAELRAAGVAMAVGSDMNPGSSYCETLEVPMWLASTHYGMSVTETWLGVTRHAARALGRHDIGILTVGARADVVLWDCVSPAEVPYRIGKNLVSQVVKDGRLVT